MSKEMLNPSRFLQCYDQIKSFYCHKKWSDVYGTPSLDITLKRPDITAYLTTGPITSSPDSLPLLEVSVIDTPANMAFSATVYTNEFSTVVARMNFNTILFCQVFEQTLNQIKSYNEV